MSQRTDSPEFAPGFIWQIILLTIVVLCFAVYARSQEEWIGGMRVKSPISIFPWMIGGKQTIENGIRAFSGRVPEPPLIDDRAKALGTLLISMVLCPTVFFLEWRRRRLATVKLQRPPLGMSGNLYALCGLVTLFVALAVGPITYFTETAWANTRHAQAVQSNRDMIINQLVLLAFDAAQYHVLPRQLGGGERSFEGFSVPETNAKTEEASYTVTSTKNFVTFRATSAKFVSCVVQVNVDSLGHMRDWRYEGEFQ